MAPVNRSIPDRGTHRRHVAEPSRYAEHLIERLGRLQAARAIAVAGVLALVVLALDLASGSRVSVSVFYVLPVSVVALRFGNRVGLSAAVTAAACWFATETISDHDVATLVSFWNGLVRLGFFAMISVLIVTVRDLLRERRDEARLDALTGVANGRGFRELAERELIRARRSNRPFTVVYIDIDRFKELNDAAGHSAGDAALKQLGSAMRDGVRTIDVIGRLGGDEFALLMPETMQPEARLLVDRLRTALGPVYTAYRIDTSIGVVTFMSTPASVDEALQRADSLMYDAKAAGRGVVRYAIEPVSTSEVVGGDEAAVDVQ